MKFLETTIHLILARTTVYLEELGHTDIYEHFPAVGRMIRAVTEADVKAWSNAEGTSKDRYDRLLSLTKDNRHEDHVIESAIDLCLAVLHIPEFAALLQYYTDSGVTLNLAYQLEGISFPSWNDVRQKLNGLSLICPIDRRKSPVKYVELMLDDRVFAFLQGDDLPGEPMNSLCSILSCRAELHPLYAYEDLARRAASHLEFTHMEPLPKCENLTPPAFSHSDSACMNLSVSFQPDSVCTDSPTKRDGSTSFQPDSVCTDSPMKRDGSASFQPETEEYDNRSSHTNSRPGTSEYEHPDSSDVSYNIPGRVVQLAGTGGRRFLTKHIGKLLGKDIILTDLADWRGIGRDDFPAYSMQLIREALFGEAGICIYGLTEECLTSMGISVSILAKYLILPAIRQNLPLILCTETGFSISPILERERNALYIPDAGNSAHPDQSMSCQRSLFLLLKLAPLDYQLRKKVWQGFISQYKLHLDAAHCAQRYLLLPSEISRVVSSFNEQDENNTPDKDNTSDKNNIPDKDNTPDKGFHFSRLCYQIISRDAQNTPGGNLGRIIYPQVRLDDIKISPSIRKNLDHMIASINGSGRIFEEWNLKEKYAYGRAVTALLCGPPGTGKTMSAHAVANALGIPLYQVNLSNIVDKYIGETEKHLEQAFLYAEKTNMVLFFDEADSLFGRRSEVSDAKDKYANTEVSYLLQRIEQFEGVVLMATNLMNNIDPAFLRRIKYLIRFQPPDEALRLAIWESCLVPELPTDHLDLPYLARQFDFCGGSIKNILLNACAISVCEDEVLNMRHILKAVRDEYLKMDRIIDTDTWGEYAYLIIP